MSEKVNLYEVRVGGDHERYVVSSSMWGAARSYLEEAGEDPEELLWIADDVAGISPPSSRKTRDADLVAIFRSLDAENAELRQKLQRMETAIWWALGRRPDDDGKWYGECETELAAAPYWWRAKLREMSGVDE